MRFKIPVAKQVADNMRNDQVRERKALGEGIIA